MKRSVTVIWTVQSQ